MSYLFGNLSATIRQHDARIGCKTLSYWPIQSCTRHQAPQLVYLSGVFINRLRFPALLQDHLHLLFPISLSSIITEMDLLKNLAGGSSDQSHQGQQSHGQQPHNQQQQHSSSGGGWGDKLGNLMGGEHQQQQQQQQHQQQQQQSSGGWGDKIGSMMGGSASKQPPPPPPTWTDKLHGMVGGGRESEKKEDALDKGTFCFRYSESAKDC